MGNVASAAASSGHSGGPPAAGPSPRPQPTATSPPSPLSSPRRARTPPRGQARQRRRRATAGRACTLPSYGGSAPALSLLLAAGGDASRQDKGGRAPLSLAALRGNLACAAALLKSGNKKAEARAASSLLGARDAHGMQATHKAAVAGHAPMLDLLLKLGADPNAAANDGSTPAHMAAYKGHVDALSALLVESPEKRKPETRSRGERTDLSS